MYRFGGAVHGIICDLYASAKVKNALPVSLSLPVIVFITFIVCHLKRSSASNEHPKWAPMSLNLLVLTNTKLKVVVSFYYCFPPYLSDNIIESNNDSQRASTLSIFSYRSAIYEELFNFALTSKYHVTDACSQALKTKVKCME